MFEKAHLHPHSDPYPYPHPRLPLHLHPHPAPGTLALRTICSAQATPTCLRSVTASTARRASPVRRHASISQPLARPRMPSLALCAIEPIRCADMAGEMAKVAVQNSLFDGQWKLSSLVVPRCIYTEPELASVGAVGLAGGRCGGQAVR